MMKTKNLVTVIFLLVFAGLKAQIPTDGLVLNLSLDGTVADSSSYKNVSENHGATPTTDRTGKPGKAMAFDGYSYIRIPSTKAIDLTTNRTVSCWAYIPSTMIPYMYPTLVYKCEPLKSSATYCVQLCGCTCYNSNQYKITALSTTNLTHYQVFSKQLYTDYFNKWSHIVSTYDTISGYMKIYINGHISDSTYCGKVVANTSTLDLNIGCGGISSDFRTFFNGSIDDVLLYNRALSAEEINKIYNEKFAVNAGSDKNAVCGGSVKLDSVTTNYSGGGVLKYKWTPSVGLSNDTIANPVCTPNGTISYKVTVTRPDSVIASDDVVVSPKSFSPLNTSTVYKYINCGESVRFDTIPTNYSGTAKLKYKWSPATGLSSVSVPNVTATPSVTTTYTVTGTLSGCTNTARVVVTVNPLPIVSITPPVPLPICPSTSVVLTASGAGTYAWSPSTGLNIASGPTVTATPVSTITYTVTGTTSGCSATARVVVNVNPVLSISITPSSPVSSLSTQTFWCSRNSETACPSIAIDCSPSSSARFCSGKSISRRTPPSSMR